MTAGPETILMQRFTSKKVASRPDDQRRIDLSQRDRSRLFVAYKKGRPESRPSDPDGSC
ncbi:hypothetical protein SM11_pC0135 (plasmid) [Sinorhizobium meliloti SM11]|uniref:Uncharacterized protein n=1 Tax=Sinorhizobium meliloti (strain SM11) TaxID=707241 RepID=F7XBA5_SINMM|nr:hypothetical protein SM11_pC0135 [Sinorhizobium meliloti SM11]